MGRVTARRPASHVTADDTVTRPETLVVEEPLEIRVNGAPVTVTMRTPGSDIELAQGFLLTEGVIGRRDDVLTVRYCKGAGEDNLNTYNVLDVTLAQDVPTPDVDVTRNFYTTSSCGVCGKASLDAVRSISRHCPGDDPSTVTAETLSAMPDRLRDAQKVFASTGGLHGAALFEVDGTTLAVREDIGRHNAVDKVIGWALEADRIPLTGTVLLVSGRASFELTQKAVMAGIPVLAAVSAPSSLAVDLASQSGLTLVAFLRGDSMNVYTRPTASNGSSTRNLHKISTKPPSLGGRHSPSIETMPEILIAPLSPIGHFGPLLNVAHGLVDRGDRVTVLTSADHAAKIHAIGATPRAIPAEADFDLTRVDIDLPGRTDTSGIKRVNFDIVRLFVQPMPHQARALSELMARTQFDAIIVDAAFFGILPFLLGDREARPPVLAYTTTPLMVSSRDTAPSGMGLPPSSTRLGRLRNRALNVLSQKVLLRESQNAANYLLDRLNSRPLPMFILDSGVMADRYISPTVPEFDYPRSDLPANVRYVGAVHPAPSPGFRLPPWWSELDGDRPVVHVTQGTIDNADLGKLVEPTIDALNGQDVIVVATTGGRDVSQLKTPLPMNTYVAEYIPHELLLPKVDVMVTNGGYGAVQRALATGVPLVVAGNTEDKPEVAARVAWTGAGINLRTGTPTVGAVRAAVREVLNDGRYLRRARDLEAAFARRDGVAEIAALVDEVISERIVAVTR